MVSISFPRETRTGLTFPPSEKQGEVPAFRLDAAAGHQPAASTPPRTGGWETVFFSRAALYIGPGCATRPFPSRVSSPRIRPGGGIDPVYRLANPLAFERRCRGPVPGRVSSRDKGDPRRGGQAQERARRGTGSTPPKRATRTPRAARGRASADRRPPR